MGGTGCCAAGGCPLPGGPPPPLGGPDPPPGGPDPPLGGPGFFLCWNACCMAEVILCDWVGVVSYIDMVAVAVVVSSVMVVMVFSGSFIVETSGLFFSVGSIGACQIC